MKQFGILLISSFLLGYILPWWIIAPAAVATAYLFEKNPLKSFLISFVTLFILWAGVALWINLNNDSILATRMSKMILQMESPILMILIAGLIGGLVSGFAGLTGTLLRKMVK
jgi:succinate dehydrogenase/fumarate reductase cytochrome b subunit